ncbi:MAG TPA: hypothetical protein P5239_11440, partial [Victivallales bacterium]|nr:hypothetical protein [Victivallales bacterium]
KESVVVALADSAEAASRSLEKPTPQKVDSIIWEIFRKKIRDGQLNDADITMKELSIIRNSFVKTISTMMHGRISYPRDNNNEEDEPDLFNRTMRKSIKEN